MKLAANIGFLYAEAPLIDRIDFAARDGLDGIECPFPYDLPPSVLAQRLRAAGLPLVLINTPQGPQGEPGFAAVNGQQEYFRAGIEQALEMAHYTACARVHVMAGRPWTEGRCEQSVLATLQENLGWAESQARRAGVVLLLEPLNRLDMPGYAYHRPAQVIQVLEHLTLPNLRMQFDTFHAARENLDVLESLLACASWIAHVQIAEAPHRTAPDLSRPETVQTLRALSTLPCGGWLGLEFESQASASSGIECLQTLRSLLLPQAMGTVA